jgi:hypothetical protein
MANRLGGKNIFGEIKISNNEIIFTEPLADGGEKLDDLNQLHSLRDIIERTIKEFGKAPERRK